MTNERVDRDLVNKPIRRKKVRMRHKVRVKTLQRDVQAIPKEGWTVIVSSNPQPRGMYRGMPL